MSTAYNQASLKVAAAALFFAKGGYHVVSAFGRDRNSVEVTVFFYDSDDRNLIELSMARYKDDKDVIVFDKFTTEGLRKFYTLTLLKKI